MSNHVITDNVESDFGIQIRDKHYIARYPLTEEVEEVQKISTRLKDAENRNDTAEIETINTELMDFIYDLISPEGHEMPIKDVLKKENIKVLQNFNTVIRKELAI